MSMDSQTLQQMVSITWNAGKATLQVVGKGAVAVGAVLGKLLASSQEERARNRIGRLLEKGEELSVYRVPEGQEEAFARKAKPYGFPFFLVRDGKEEEAGAMVLVRKGDAIRAGRILEGLEKGQRKEKKEEQVVAKDRHKIPLERRLKEAQLEAKLLEGRQHRPSFPFQEREE